MIIDTRKKVISIQLRRMITLLIFALSVICILLIGKMPNTILGLNKYHWSLVMLVLFVLSVFAESMLQLNYIFFYDEKDKLILRYFSLGYMNRLKKAIEFPKSELLSYQVYEYLGGKKKKLVLLRIKNGKEAKYPPVTLSILSKEKINDLLNSLDSYKKI